MARLLNNALKVALVTEWREVKGSTSQRDFVAQASKKHGIKLTARTLRSWCRDLDLAQPDHQLERLRRLATDALDRVRSVEAELARLVGSLGETPAASVVTTSLDERQPPNDSAADDPVDRTCATGGAPPAAPNTLTPAMPPSKDVPETTSGSQEAPKKFFVWDLDL